MDAKRVIVVTGAAGLIGTVIVQKLLSLGDSVHAVVHRPLLPSHPLMEHLNREPADTIEVHVLDLAVASSDWIWLEEIQPSIVIHCAAMTNVDACERDLESTYRLNTLVTRSLAEVSARSGIHLLLISTDYVFDGSKQHPGPYYEYDPIRPVNHYGRSKWLAEIALQECCDRRTSWSICRTATVYSSGHGTRASFATWVLAKLRTGEPIRIAFDQISSPTLAEDLVDMILALIEQRSTGIFHTVGDTVIDRYQFALALARYHNLDSSLIRPVTTQELQQFASRPLKGGLHTEKIKKTLNIMPLPLNQAILRFMESTCIDSS